MQTAILERFAGEQDSVTVQLFENDMSLFFPYHKDAIEQVKKVEGAQYHGPDKSWSFIVTEDNWSDLQDLIVALRDFFRREQARAEHREQVQKDIASTVLERLQMDFDHPDLTLGYEDGYITVSFPYNPKALKVIKKVPERRWDGNEKVWLLPADLDRKIRSALQAILRTLN